MIVNRRKFSGQLVLFSIMVFIIFFFIIMLYKATSIPEVKARNFHGSLIQDAVLNSPSGVYSGCSEQISHKITILSFGINSQSRRFLNKHHFPDIINLINADDLNSVCSIENRNNLIICASEFFANNCPKSWFYGIINGETYLNPKMVKDLLDETFKSQGVGFLIFDNGRLNSNKDNEPCFAVLLDLRAVQKIPVARYLHHNATESLGFGTQFVHYIISQEGSEVNVFESSDLVKQLPTNNCERTRLVAIQDVQRWQYDQLYLIWLNSEYQCIGDKARERRKPLAKIDKFDCGCN